MPNLEGKWYIVGPFDNFEGRNGFGQAYPPEKEAFGADKSYSGKGGATVAWKEFPAFKPGAVVKLRVFEDDDDACCYLYHAFTVEEPVELPLLCGFDDCGIVWLNGTGWRRAVRRRAG